MQLEMFPRSCVGCTEPRSCEFFGLCVFGEVSDPRLCLRPQAGDLNNDEVIVWHK